MSRILNRQRQLAEQGRLRLGYTAEANNGRTRPVRSETWILTSHSREHIDTAAQLWGGVVEQWQPMGNGAPQWRVITKANTIDAILPPGDPLSQAYEQWNRGGCVRRCDGVTEQLSGSPCICLQQHGEDWYEQPQGKVCDSKSRLKVLLPDMPGLGSWRMETGSYYATDEIAGMVDVLKGAAGDQVMIPVRLRIEPRTRVAGGQTKHFVVPVLELRGVTSGALLAGQYGGLKALTGGQDDSPAQLEAAPPIDWFAKADEATSIEEVRNIWSAAGAAGGLSDDLKEHLKNLSAELSNPGPAPAGSPTSAVEAEAEPDPDQVWQQVLSLSGQMGMSLDDIRNNFTAINEGIPVEEADGFRLATYLEHLKENAA